MENSKPDENSRGSLIAISSIDGSIVQLYADPITHRLLVDLPGGAGTVTSITASTGILITPTPLTSTGTVGLSVPLQPLASLTGNAGKFLRVNAGETAVEYAPVSTGGVTSVSVTPANGFTGSVATPTSTPAITLTLQNATTSQSGQLTSTDWNTFNGKQTALGFTPYNATNPNGYTSNVGDVTLTGTQTLTNKTLTAPVISTITNTGTLTLPTTTGTVALTSQITGTNSGTNTGDNAANTTYASDYRAANFVAGTNYQAPLVSGTSIKTINSTSLLGSGDIVISGTDATKLPLAGGTMTGMVTLATGTTSLAPIKMVAGVKLTTPIAGVFEFDGTDLFFSI